jgi:S1-C subfamily serine protease
MPIPGEPLEIPHGSEFPGNPVFEGMSFGGLSDLMGALVRTETPKMRGSREIAIFRQAAPAVVLIKTKEGSGSGVVLQDGSVLTNRHVVEGIGQVQMFFKPDDMTNDQQAMETRSGTVKFVDRQRDLAIVAPYSLPNNFKFLKISTRDDAEVGSDVYAIGHPLGYAWTFTQGIISGVRTIKTESEHYTAVQTQTPINPGNSGGPLLNSEGEVVGINTWVRDISNIEKKQVDGEDLAISRPAQGLNFAVSARDLRGFLSDVSNGRVTNLVLRIPTVSPGCSGQTVFNGRTKSNDAALRTFSLKCDGVADAWELFPDDKSKPIEFHVDTDRSGKSSIVVFSNTGTGKWESSLWDFFRDQTYAVIGHHDDGKIQPTRFEYARS